MIRAYGRNGRRDVAYLALATTSEATYRSLQIQIIGRRRGFAGVFAIYQLLVHRYVLTLLFRWYILYQLDQTPNKALPGQPYSQGGTKHTASPPPEAPSISSITTHVGFPSLARPDPASIAFLIRVVTVAADLSSDALISSVL